MGPLTPTDPNCPPLAPDSHRLRGLQPVKADDGAVFTGRPLLPPVGLQVSVMNPLKKKKNKSIFKAFNICRVPLCFIVYLCSSCVKVSRVLSLLIFFYEICEIWPLIALKSPKTFDVTLPTTHSHTLLRRRFHLKGGGAWKTYFRVCVSDRNAK